VRMARWSLAAIWAYPIWRLVALGCAGLGTYPGVAGLADAVGRQDSAAWVVITSPHLYNSARWAFSGRPHVYAIDRPVNRRVTGLTLLPRMERKTLDQVASASGVPAIYVVSHVQRESIEPSLPPGWALNSTRVFRESMTLGSPTIGEIVLREFVPS